MIGGNGSDGITIDGGASNQVLGNYIGSDASGNVANGNGQHGVYVVNTSTGNTIQNNVIAASTQHGVLISGESADGNSVLGNRIGVFANDTLSALGIVRGISLANGADNTIIGAPGAGNWIAGTSGTAMVVIGDSNGTIIQNNRIGTDLTGTANWGPQLHGIYLGNGANGSLIGGTNAGEGNLIAFGAQAGEAMTASASSPTPVPATRSLATASTAVAVRSAWASTSVPAMSRPTTRVMATPAPTICRISRF